MQKILIIDDELFFRTFISDNLGREGYETVSASDGGDGLAVLEKELGNIAVVLLDIVMPNVDGLAVLEEIKNNFPELPVIMMTAHMDQELVLKALKNGAFDYLAKPLFLEELLISVKRAYDHYQLVVDKDNSLRQLKNLEAGAHRLLELAAGSVSIESVIDKNKLLQGSIDLIANVLEAEKVSMMLLNEEKKELRVVVASGHNMDLSALPVRRLGEGIAGTVAEKGESILVRNMKEGAAYTESIFAGQYKIDSFLCVPVTLLGKIIGVISVNDKRTGIAFNESDLTVLTTFSHQVAMTLENAMINADMERYIEKLTMLNEVSKTILNMVDPKEIFRDIVKRTREIIETELCLLYISDEKTGNLKLEAGFSEKAERTLSLTIKSGHGITGLVMEHGNMVVTDDISKDSRYIEETDGFPGIKTKGFICAPLKIKEKSLGVLKLVNKLNGRNFTVRDRELVESIASHSSIALKNAWLYENLVASVDDVASTNRDLEKVNLELKLRLKEIDVLKKGSA